MFLRIICSHEKCAFICQLYANIMFSVKSLCLLLFLAFFLPGQNCLSRTRSILTSRSKCRFLSTARPVNFVWAETDKIDRFLLQTVKNDWAVNFDWCRDGQNVPSFISPQSFIEKNWNFRSTLWTVELTLWISARSERIICLVTNGLRLLIIIPR